MRVFLYMNYLFLYIYIYLHPKGSYAAERPLQSGSALGVFPQGSFPSATVASRLLWEGSLGLYIELSIVSCFFQFSDTYSHRDITFYYSVFCLFLPNNFWVCFVSEGKKNKLYFVLTPKVFYVHHRCFQHDYYTAQLENKDQCE